MRATAIRLLHACILASSLLAGSAGAATHVVQGTNIGPIPDNDAAGRSVAFAVSNLKGRVRSVSVTMEITHSFIGDLDVRLISPGGRAQLVLFSRPGGSRASADGMHANLAGTYTFADTAVGDLWGTIKPQTTDFLLPSGSYRASTGGRLLLSDVGGCATHLDRVFGGLSGADVNGQWTLKISDRGPQDFGAVNVVTLHIDIDDGILAGGFEDLERPTPTPVSDTRGRCKNTPFDFTGSGLTSYATVHSASDASESPLLWTVRDNNGGDDGALQQFEFGLRNDQALDGDYDGDGIGDAVVWNNLLEAFLVRRSSRPTDVPLTLRMGQSHNSTLSGDYDGDGVTDAAVYREGYPAPGQAALRIALSRSGTVRTLLLGANEAYASGGVDADGDGRADIAIQRLANDGSDLSRYDLYTSAGTLFDTFVIGSEGAYTVPGRHLGPISGSLTLADIENSQWMWRTRNLDTDVVTDPFPFGLDDDTLLGGDYDGDGVDDYAFWREAQGAVPGMFVVRRSTSPDAAPLELPASAPVRQVIAASRVN